MERSTEDLLKEIADLKEANAYLLDGHAKMTVAYLATRVNKLEERLDEAGKVVMNLSKKIAELSK